MTFEEQLSETLRRADGYAPSPDLFARVQRSIEEDIAHRRRIRRVVATGAAGVAAVSLYLAALVDVVDGQLVMAWWSAEVLGTSILVVLILVLGPLIRRFGKTYVGDVFWAGPRTGKRFLVLLDLAYYLIFMGYVLVTARFDSAIELADVPTRIAGLLLIMGVLHGLTIFSMPVIGLVFSSTWRRKVRATLGDEAPLPHTDAQTADRVATLFVWGFTGLVLVLVFFVVIQLVLGLGLGS
jgi:hypothetical protein